MAAEGEHVLLLTAQDWPATAMSCCAVCRLNGNRSGPRRQADAITIMPAWALISPASTRA